MKSADCIGSLRHHAQAADSRQGSIGTHKAVQNHIFMLVFSVRFTSCWHTLVL